MEIIKTYMLHWFGPFKSIEEVAKWEQENREHVCNLYLIEGKRPYARTVRHYYCGKTIQSIHKRLNNLNHHICELRTVDEIWMGCIRNVLPGSQDIFELENIITAYLADEVGDNKMLNEINKKFPKHQICVINRWYKPTQFLWNRIKNSDSPARIIPEVILHYYHEKFHLISGADKLKHLKFISD